MTRWAATRCRQSVALVGENGLSLKQSLKDGAWNGLAVGERLLSGSGRPLSDARNFLLLQYPAPLGTAIHATPLVPALREAVPGCRIVVAANGLAAEVFRGNPGVDRLIETPSPIKDLLGAVRGLREQKLFGGEAFVTVTSTGNERTKIALQAMLSGAAVRVGFTVVPQLYRVALRFDYSMSQIANNLKIIGALGHAVRHFEPQIFFSETDMAEAHRLLIAGGIEGAAPIAIFVTQTSVTQRKSWRAERFQAAARFLHDTGMAAIVFVGTAAESAAIEELRGGLQFPTLSVAGRTSLPVLAALMSRARVGLSLDTGPMHIGRAVGLPMVIVAPAWSPTVEWLPLGDERFHILKNAEMPVATPDYVIDEVGIDEVVAGLADLMTRYADR